MLQEHRPHPASGAPPSRFLTPLLYGTGTTSKPLGAHVCRDIDTGHGVPAGCEMVKMPQTV
ncbi:hypothetical protein ABZ646_28150 [Streptomyces sp. NPDC007162]|uniref:hypothetical protein n=1 Tax=Streptomyces sp. NPDC007162 TaxID=3156917 RepID=UPI0033EE2CC1